MIKAWFILIMTTFDFNLAHLFGIVPKVDLRQFFSCDTPRRDFGLEVDASKV